MSFIYIFLNRKRALLKEFYRAALAAAWLLELVGWGTLIWFFSIAGESMIFFSADYIIKQSNANSFTFLTSY